MTKAEWDAMTHDEKDEIVGESFPEIDLGLDDWALSRNGSGPGFDSFYTEEEANGALLKYQECAAIYDEATVVHWRQYQRFTTDRNACALVLDEILEHGRDTAQRMLLELAGLEGLMADKHWPDITTGRPGVTSILWCGLNASPDTICFCAIQAVSDE